MKKIHHFILKNFSFTPGVCEITEKVFVHQIITVLKLRVGEKIVIGDGKSNQAEVLIEEISKQHVRVFVGSITVNQNEVSQHVILYCALLKRENFEWVVEKATELGVKEIIPLITQRTIKGALNQARLQKIAHEAAEQCERSIVPIIHDPIHFDQVFVGFSKEEGAVLFDVTGSSVRDKSGYLYTKKKIHLFIGPEGGWVDEEVKKAQKYGVEIISLGKTVLRAETAVVAGCFWVSQFSLV